MDKIKIEPFSENRLHDITFAQTYLRIANGRGMCLEDTINLTEELYRYIIYLYQHIEQLEKDKQYLLKQNLKTKPRQNKSTLNEGVYMDNAQTKVNQDAYSVKPGGLYFFYTTDSSLKKYNGTKVSVLRQLTADECDISDVGNMYKVRFEDGYERDAFEDELVKGREKNE